MGSAGGALHYEGRGRKKRDALYYPVPTGPVVSYLGIVARLEPGTTHNVIGKYRKLHLMPISFTQFVGAVTLTIDDSKIHMLDKDGNRVDR